MENTLELNRTTEKTPAYIAVENTVEFAVALFFSYYLFTGFEVVCGGVGSAAESFDELFPFAASFVSPFFKKVIIASSCMMPVHSWVVSRGKTNVLGTILLYYLGPIITILLGIFVNSHIGFIPKLTFFILYLIYPVLQILNLLGLYLAAFASVAKTGEPVASSSDSADDPHRMICVTIPPQGSGSNEIKVVPVESYNTIRS